MSAEGKIMIEIITSWIHKAFSVFVPKWGLGWMGTGQLGDKARSFPADSIPNLRIFLSFSSPAYCLLHTAYWVLPTALYLRPFALYLSLTALYLRPIALYLGPFALYLRPFSLSPSAICSLLEANCSLLRDICSYLSKEA